MSEPISLREYVDAQIHSLERIAEMSRINQQTAIDKAERNMEKRLDGMNEFRNSLSDQSRMLMPRIESEKAHKELSDRVDTLASRLNSRDDRGRGMGEIWGYIVGALGVIALIASVVLARIAH
jgi:hypothetical protein